MKQKKLMLLGGIRYLLPAIETAHKHDYYVITVDNVPDNIAHKYSVEYDNLSIIDNDAILSLAKRLQIDGILSYAVDPGVITAAYVAEKMGLPFTCSYDAACILQDKARFRQFLSENGFNVPTAKGYTNVEDALNDVNLFHWPVIVKPVDSAGSKGVSRVDTVKDLQLAISHALEVSHKKQFIIEDLIECEGLPSGTECFAVNGELKYNGFYDQYYDYNAANPYTPSAECWPSNKEERYIEEIRSELQRLLNLLNIKTGILNVEWRVNTEGKCYLMEVSPRAGGNRLAEMLRIATDVDIIDAEIQKSLNEPHLNIHEPKYSGYYAIMVLHSKKNGIFKGLKIKNIFKKKFVIEEEIRVKFNDSVESFTGANAAIGSIFLKFQDRQECNFFLPKLDRYINVIVE